MLHIPVGLVLGKIGLGSHCYNLPTDHCLFEAAADFRASNLSKSRVPYYDPTTRVLSLLSPMGVSG
jgi:hypothetical protein